MTFGRGRMMAGVVAGASLALGGCGVDGRALGGVLPPSPVVVPWVVDGPDDSSAVAAAALSGWYAVGDSFEDSVEVRWVDRSLRAVISKAQISALLPWMSLDGSADGVNALAFSDSGRLLFIGVHDDRAATDGLPGDAILRYETQTGQLTVFARVETSNAQFPWPSPGLAHFAGRLYVGGPGVVRVFRAQANDTAGTLLFTATAGSGGALTTAIAIDRETRTLYAGWGSTIARAAIGASSLAFTTVGTRANLRALAWSDHFGGSLWSGLYALTGTSSPESATVWQIPAGQARGTLGFAPVLYTSAADDWHDLAATADGAMLIGADEDAVVVREGEDPWRPLGEELRAEFEGVVEFASDLITPTTSGPGAEPAGWVIDANVPVGGTLFHPASPDGAAWVVMLLMMSEEVSGDATAQGKVRLILERYAGRAATGPAPGRNADGMFLHWIDPGTGRTKAGWLDEYATMSTMKIVHAAALAAARWPGDESIQASARAIACGVSDWGLYVSSNGRSVALQGLASGPNLGTMSGGWHESVLFTRQAGYYEDGRADVAAGVWGSRAGWPTATWITGRPVTTNIAGQFQPGFIPAYALLLVPEFRADGSWLESVDNFRASHAAWTDDNGPRYSTMFSAGTTKGIWGGYNADSLTNNPGLVTTFPALMAMVGDPRGARLPEAVAAYQAIRRGARQSFRGGASILYRRSDVDRAYSPDSAGLPDVAMGALGLAEMLSPGSVDAVLGAGGAFFDCRCPADVDGSGGVPDIDDIVRFFELFGAGVGGPGGADVNGSGGIPDIDDIVYFFERFGAGC